MSQASMMASPNVVGEVEWPLVAVVIGSHLPDWPMVDGEAPEVDCPLAVTAEQDYGDVDLGRARRFRVTHRPSGHALPGRFTSHAKARAYLLYALSLAVDWAVVGPDSQGNQRVSAECRAALLEVANV